MNFSKKRKEIDNEVEKNQTITINKNNSHNYFRIKSVKISSEIAKILPNIQKYKIIRNPDTSKLFISNLNPQIMNKKLPTINLNETSSQSSSLLYQSDYEKNIMNNNIIQTTEKNTNEQNLEKQILYKKLNHQRKSQLLTRTKLKNVENKTKDFTINSSILNNTKFLRESKNNSMSCIFNKKSNNIGESQLFNENNLSKGYNNYNEINTNAQNNNSIIKKKLLGDKLQKFIKIKRNVMMKKNKIYNDQKNKLKAMVNIYNFAD